MAVLGKSSAGVEEWPWLLHGHTRLLPSCLEHNHRQDVQHNALGPLTTLLLVGTRRNGQYSCLDAVQLLLVVVVVVCCS